MMGLSPGKDAASDFTSHISDNLGYPIARGSFGEVYRCTVESSIGEMEVAVKVFRTDGGRTVDKLTKAVLRELKVWLKLNHPNILPLLGTARVESPLLALVSQWMPSGTLSNYLEQRAAAITSFARDGLVKGIAEGLDYLHTKNVIHGDLHPGNILINDSGSPCIADFGLATVAEDPELQWTTTTAERLFSSRFRAPEVLGVHYNPKRPTFESDVYSFGSVMFFILSGDVPWKGKNSYQISIELSKRATHARSQNIFDYHWDLIRKCWSWEPENRPKARRVLHVLEKSPQETSLMGTLINGQVPNIVIFGETGAGKSSVINLMAGGQVAGTSPGSCCCTLQWTEYRITINNGTQYRVFDTVGLEDPVLDTNAHLSAITNAYDLINKLRENGGINLLLFCIRGGRVTATMKSNYRLFFEFFCDEKVPLALVVTGLEREEDMEDWYRRNVDRLEKHNIRSVGHACITAANFLDGRHSDKCEMSRRIICNIVQTHCNALTERWTGGQGWFTSLLGESIHFVTGRPKKTDIIGVLARRCGMSRGAAQQIAESIRGE